uniref:Vesicle-fusing ATPase n=1 Tax=Salix viminalis TaxID=40686 RepID=A0A6N2L8F8_SALVM
MYSNFKEQAIEYVKQAVQEDNAGNYSKAFPLYMNALEYFKTHLKYEKNPKIREAITQKFTEYLRRAEEIRTVLDEGGPGPSSNGDAAVATRPKTKPKDGEDGDDPEKDKLRSGLNSAIVREKPNVKWNDVAGLESAKQALQEAVILPVKFPQFFTGKRRPWRAFLLYGPPGTGKSYLAKAVATEADSTFFSISSSDLVSKWMGESEKLVSNLFQMARESAPSIIFVDEIDSLCGQRGEGNESEASRRIKTELLVQMQGVGTNDQKVLVLAATNTPYALDQAIRRRFDKRIYIPLPDLKARQHIFKVHLGDTPHNLTESDFESLARRTEGFSGSDISVCVKDVLFEPVRKTQDAMFFIHASNDMWIPCGPKHPGAVQISMQDLAAQGLAEKILPPPIMKTDFDKVLARQKPTVSKTDLDVHERFTKEFGEEDPAKIKREDFLVCMAEALIDDPRKKAVAAQLGGGVAMILIDPIVKEICFQFVVPSTLIGQEEAQQLQAYMQAQKAKRVTDPLDDKAKARLVGTQLSYVSSGSEHSADDDDDLPCLSELVHGFLENDDSDLAHEPVNGHESDSDRVDSVADCTDFVEDILRSGSKDSYRSLLSAHVSKAMEAFSCLRNQRPVLRRKDTMRRSVRLNGNLLVAVVLTAGGYEFIDVVQSKSSTLQNRYVVDLDFASQFEIARPTSQFLKLLHSLPRVFVGRSEDLKTIVRRISNAAKKIVEE